MKIAIFSDCFLGLTGGIVSAIRAEKSELERLGHTVYVFSTSYPMHKRTRTLLAQEHIYPVPCCKVFFYKLTPVSRRPRIVEDYLVQNFPELKTFDIFHIHYEAGLSIAGLRLGRRYGIPTVQTMHGREDMGETNLIPFGLRTLVAFFLDHFHSWYLPHPVKIRRDRYLANSRAKARMWSIMVNHANAADCVIAPTAHFCDKLKTYGVTRPIIVVPNGFPDNKYIPSLTPRVSRPSTELKIIWHSRLSSEKRIMVFLEALREVKGAYRLDVYGGGGDHFRAQRYVYRHHLNVFFHGNRDFNVIYEHLLKSDLDVLVSYNGDTFGMTLIEAESAGVPALICDPDMCEVLPSGGYVLASGPSSSQIAAALQGLLDNRERITKMSKVMLNRRAQTLMSHRVKKLLKVFEELVDKKTSPGP